MAIEDEEETYRLSRRVATTWVVISLAVAVMIGVIGLGMTEAGELEMLHWRVLTSETIIVKIADLLSTHGVLPALLARYDPGRNPGIYDVHRRFTASGCFFLLFLPTFSAQFLKNKEETGRLDAR